MKIRIGENEYDEPITLFDDAYEGGLIDGNGMPVDISDLHLAIKELASLRQSHPDTVGDEATNFDAYLSLNPTAFRIFNDMRQERDDLKTRVEGLGEAVDIGVIEFHTKQNAELRNEFYEVVDDLRNAGSIVDVWLLDIGAVLKKHGYTLKIYRNTNQEESPDEV